MANGKFVAYYRVSTEKQGASGLGLEAQKAAVENYLNGGHWELIGEYTEVETGGGANALDKRPQLKAALAAAKKAKATLVIAKLDRLARNVHFVTGLLETGVEFVAADMPAANKMMIQIHAVMSEYERDQISARTKAAYDAKKARLAAKGEEFRSNLHRRNEQRQQDADKFVEKVRPTIATLRALNLSQRSMVKTLNDQGTPAPRGGKWSLLQVQRVLGRLAVVG